MVDADAVSITDLEEWSAEFGEVLSRLSSLFVHPSSRRHAEQYVRGLLSPIVRKNGWTIAEYAGEKEPKAMQRFLNLASWDAESLRDVVCDYARMRTPYRSRHDGEQCRHGGHQEGYSDRPTRS